MSNDSVEHADLVVEYSTTNCQEVGRVDVGGAGFEDESIPGRVRNKGRDSLAMGACKYSKHFAVRV